MSLPGEPFYLIKNASTISQVVQSNWEQLGVNVPSEQTLGAYYKVAKPVVDHVCNELEQVRCECAR